jgi:hypothetical protein
MKYQLTGMKGLVCRNEILNEKPSAKFTCFFVKLLVPLETKMATMF